MYARKCECGGLLCHSSVHVFSAILDCALAGFPLHFIFGCLQTCTQILVRGCSGWSWFPALVPACVCLPTTASLCNRQKRGWLQVVLRSAIATAVAEEALRLKPPAKLVFRKAVRDTKLAGIRVPAGTSVMCHIVQVRFLHCASLHPVANEETGERPRRCDHRVCSVHCCGRNMCIRAARMRHAVRQSRARSHIPEGFHFSVLCCSVGSHGHWEEWTRLRPEELAI